jgi:hypothetical protein
MRVKNDLLLVQKAVIEKDSLPQETTVPPRYNEPYIPADQAFVISKFVNAITNYSV